MKTFSDYCKEAHETASANGFHNPTATDGTQIALMHSELSEALEAMRKPDQKDEHLPDEDPVALEMADVLIRIFDFCQEKGIDLQNAVDKKMAYNKTRPYKHGNKKF